MSQFLLCKSKNDLLKYGVKVEDVVGNKTLYFNVINQYMYNDNIENIWVINKIHEMVDELKNNIDNIIEICCKSEKMIFWYGSDFEELEVINSTKELRDFLKKNISAANLEIYIQVLNRKESFSDCGGRE